MMSFLKDCWKLRSPSFLHTTHFNNNIDTNTGYVQVMHKALINTLDKIKMKEAFKGQWQDDDYASIPYRSAMLLLVMLQLPCRFGAMNRFNPLPTNDTPMRHDFCELGAIL